jgi:hypothetical protein
MTALSGPTLELMDNYGVWSTLDQEAVALAAARDAHINATPPANQPTPALASIDAEGQRMTSELGHSLERELQPIEENLRRLGVDIAAQEHVVKAREQATSEHRGNKEQAKSLVDAIARVKGAAFIELRKVSRWPYIASMAVLGSADTILNATALQVIGEGNLVLWGLAFALAVALLWMAHVAGTEMREADERPNDRHERRQRWVALAAVLGVMVVFLITIGYIRAEFLEAQGMDGELLAVYGLQLVVVAAAVAVAYYHANSYARALEHHDAMVQQAEAAQAEEEETLRQLEGERQALETGKVSVVAGFLRAGETALLYAEELKKTYVEVYFQARKPDAPPIELFVPPPHIPGWMFEWKTWINRQTIVDRPLIGTDWQQEYRPALPD